MVDIIKKAVFKIQSSYNCEDWKERTQEFGAVLWLDKSGCLTYDKIITGDYNGVDPYPQHIVKKINQSVDDTNSEFIGDFHAHPAKDSIAGHLPSFNDLFLGYVIQDIWGNGTQIPGQVKPQHPPKLQLILLVQSGDVIVIKPVHGRTKFQNLEEQSNALYNIAIKYRNFHRNLNSRYPFYPLREEKIQGIEVVRKEIALRINKINRIVGHRIRLDIKENKRGDKI